MSVERNKAKEVRLRCWEEAVGQCKGVEQGEFGVSITIGKLRVIFPINSHEAEAQEDELNDNLLGHRVGVLRTDKSFLIRVDEKGSDNPSEILRRHTVVHQPQTHERDEG